MKGTGRVLGALIVVTAQGYGLLSNQLSAGQLLDELLGGGKSGAASDARAAPLTNVAKQQLSELRVRAANSMAGYSREKFPHWSDTQEFGSESRCHSHLGHVFNDGPREAGGQRWCMNSGDRSNSSSRL